MSDVIISNTLDKKEVTKLWNLNNVKRKVFGSSSSAHNSYNNKYLLEHEQKFCFEGQHTVPSICTCC